MPQPWTSDRPDGGQPGLWLPWVQQPVLLDCVGALGLDQAEAKKVLASDQYEAAVRQDEETYQNAGVSSVPAFIINRKYLISGAQDRDVLVKALRDISEAAAESV